MVGSAFVQDSQKEATDIEKPAIKGTIKSQIIFLKYVMLEQ